MKISGFTIVRNASTYNYPVLESIRSILPICDEFIVNVGDSKDDTLSLARSIKDPKIKIIENLWDMSMGEKMLSFQTNLALKECTGDWAFYLQSDEVIHEKDLPTLKRIMAQHIRNDKVDCLRLPWLHFYGSYYRYRIDAGWFQKSERIIKNNGTIESCGDAAGFRRKDGRDLKRIKTRCLLYHYGWVHSGEVMAHRRWNAEQIGFARLQPEERKSEYVFGDLNRFPIYFGEHPCVMKERVQNHALSQEDWHNICRRYWYHPAKIFRIRYKTGKRIGYRMGM